MSFLWFDRKARMAAERAAATVRAMEDIASLEPHIDEIRRAFEGATARVVEHLAHANDQPATGDVDDTETVRRIREQAPELVDEVMREHVPRSLTSNGPGYMAYVPGGGIHTAAIADLVADVTNRFTGSRFAAPALVELEANALEWLRDMMQMPETTRGIFTSGGSMATFNAIVCARERLLGEKIRCGVLYTSTQAHHSVTKSARLAGILGDRVRALPVDASYRLRVDALEAAIDEDARAGLRPFAVVSAAGTTNTGAVDPLDATADVCARRGLWHHVDGAYGAFFHACEELRPLLAGLPRADSLTLDPHKGLFLPYGTGALLVRDGSALRAVHASTAGYLPAAGTEDLYDPSQLGPELSRGFPGLRVWLTFKAFGARKLRAAISEKRALAVSAAERIARIPGVVLDAEPQLSLFAFHLAREGASMEQRNADTRVLLDRVVRRGRTFLSGCTIEGHFHARVCVLSFRTRATHVDACVEDVREAADAILRTSCAGRTTP
jgi:aromatic-L-amino-acid/L-tryptophan decarboxylase